MLKRLGVLFIVGVLVSSFASAGFFERFFGNDGLRDVTGMQAAESSVSCTDNGNYITATNSTGDSNFYDACFSHPTFGENNYEYMCNSSAPQGFTLKTTPCPSGQVCHPSGTGGVCSTRTCSDNDPSSDTDDQGTVTLTFGNGDQESHQDYCALGSLSASHVVEVSCASSSSGWSASTVACPSSSTCQNGECAPTTTNQTNQSTPPEEEEVVVEGPQGICSEFDEQNNPRVFGVVKTLNLATEAVAELPDNCANTGLVTQYRCDPANPLQPGKSDTACPQGTQCSAGICATPLQIQNNVHLRNRHGILTSISTRGARVSATAQAREKGTAVGRGGIPKLAGLDLGARAQVSTSRPLQSGNTKLSIVSSAAGKVTLKLESTMQVSNNQIIWFNNDAFSVKVNADGSVSLENVPVTTTAAGCACSGGGQWPCECTPAGCGSCSVSSSAAAGTCTCSGGGQWPCSCDPPGCGSCAASVGGFDTTTKTGAIGVPGAVQARTTTQARAPTAGTGGVFNKIISIFR